MISTDKHKGQVSEELPLPVLYIDLLTRYPHNDQGLKIFSVGTVTDVSKKACG